ncbi:hypothetical protein AAVH_36006, partial [Aphelenchoides avenae]
RYSGGKKNLTDCPKTIWVTPTTKCSIYNDKDGRWGPKNGVWRDCAPDPVCESNAYDPNFRCCSSDYCNGGES